MRTRLAALIALSLSALSLSACAGKTELKPQAGEQLPPAPYGRDVQPTANRLLEPPGQAPLLLAAAAINRDSEPAEGFPDAEDPATARRSAERLLQIARDTGARLIPGHEPTHWPRLPKAPAEIGAFHPG